MKRPVGLILTAIVLSLAALFFLILSVLMAFAGVLTGHPSAATPNAILYVALAFSVIYAALAAWAVLTIIGILRLRSWARYSILIIGGGLAAFGTLAALFSILFSRWMLPTFQAQQPTVDPHVMSIIFLFTAALYLLVGAIGIWWLVYFNLRFIRDLFRTPTLALANPYAEPPMAALPAKSYDGFFSSPEHAPSAIKILGWLFLLFAICCLPITLIPLPAFILGFIVPVKASHFLYLGILLLAGFIGYGLLKLWNSARLALIVFTLFGIFNMAVTLLPWSQNHLRDYTAQIVAQFTAMLPTIPNQANPIYASSAAMVVFNSTVGIAVNLYILWLAHRHRPAFTAPPPVPEL